MARVLVLDGHSAAALAITRSLGKASHWIAIGSNQGIHSPAEVSRYCRARLRHPIPSDDASGFVESVLQFAKRNAIDLIFPVTDWTVLPLSKYRALFFEVSQLALGSHSALEACADKFKTLTAARELGIPVPETALIRSIEDLEGGERFEFPVVVKDRFSARWEGNRAILGSVSYAYSLDDLRQKVEHRLTKAGDVLIQTFVKGAGIGFSSLTVDNNIHMPFMWLRVREIDPRGSGSSARRSIPVSKEVLAYSRSLINRLGLQGISMVEFKQPPSEGPPVLMEINARPWASLQLPICCGIDYPNYLVNWLLRNDSPIPEITYKQGITCRRLVGDLTHLEHVFRGAPLGWPLSYPRFLTTLLKISVPWYPGLRYDDLSFTDPRPGFAGLKHWCSLHLNRFKT